MKIFFLKHPLHVDDQNVKFPKSVSGRISFPIKMVKSKYSLVDISKIK